MLGRGAAMILKIYANSLKRNGWYRCYTDGWVNNTAKQFAPGQVVLGWRSAPDQVAVKFDSYNVWRSTSAAISGQQSSV